MSENINGDLSTENTLESTLETNTTTEAITPAEADATPPTDVTIQTLTARQVEFKMAEQLLRIKYPHLKIVEGSLKQDVDHPHFGNKRRVTVICPGTGVEVERATSDLHTFQGSPAHMKTVRKNNKAKKKLAQLVAAGAVEAPK